ncbi:MAG TPA: Asp23/Gls24 family envelope stress response protein [Chloroflexota bacterium]|nr:Asp23/Gls24 family envelope stress response protein [Chloroflexota bacterium]
MTPEADFCSVRISPGVLATIAGLTTMSVPGVLRTSRGLVGGVSRLVGRDDPTQGVKLRVKDELVYLDIHVVVEQGADLVRVGGQIQRDVAQAIDKMVGLPVAEINVYVQDME